MALLNDKHARGFFRKFNVERMDGRDGLGQKHHDCQYFVLDLNHDPYAIPALAAYADSCEADYPALAADLRTWVFLKSNYQRAQSAQ